MNKNLRIATRQSPLALWQAEYVKSALLRQDPGLKITLVGVTTAGDREQTKALTNIGGKSLFVKELQKNILEQQADIAVHSIKDMSVQDCPGLCLAAICEREDPRDAFVSTEYSSLNELPSGAIIGTASPRRTALLKSNRPDIHTKLIRGNVGTRLKKCQQQEYDGTILAVAGLKRLDFERYISEHLDPSLFIPAIGQGAIGVECREDDKSTRDLLATINHPNTEYCVLAERMVNRILGGDCHTPIAAYATIDNQGMLSLHSMVGSLDGKTILKGKTTGSPAMAALLGEAVAQQLLDQGAKELLKQGS